MANINGDVQKRVTLTANVETVVSFLGEARNVALQAIGGTVIFKINGSISDINDNTANILQDGASFDDSENEQIDSLHLMSATATVVQWDTY